MVISDRLMWSFWDGLHERKRRSWVGMTRFLVEAWTSKLNRVWQHCETCVELLAVQCHGCTESRIHKAGLQTAWWSLWCPHHCNTAIFHRLLTGEVFPCDSRGEKLSPYAGPQWPWGGEQMAGCSASIYKQKGVSRCAVHSVLLY
jgi:hypothetical protein